MRKATVVEGGPFDFGMALPPCSSSAAPCLITCRAARVTRGAQRAQVRWVVVPAVAINVVDLGRCRHDSALCTRAAQRLTCERCRPDPRAPGPVVASILTCAAALVLCLPAGSGVRLAVAHASRHQGLAPRLSAGARCSYRHVATSGPELSRCRPERSRFSNAVGGRRSRSPCAASRRPPTRNSEASALAMITRTASPGCCERDRAAVLPRGRYRRVAGAEAPRAASPRACVPPRL